MKIKNTQLALSAVLLFAATSFSLPAKAKKIEPQKSKQLSCNAFTNNLQISTPFSAELKPIVRDPQRHPNKHTYFYWKYDAFRTRDGRFSIGLAAVQPINDPEFKYNAIEIWVQDVQSNGPFSRVGQIYRAYSDQKTQSITIQTGMDEGESGIPGGNGYLDLVVECSLK